MVGGMVWIFVGQFDCIRLRWLRRCCGVGCIWWWVAGGVKVGGDADAWLCDCVFVCFIPFNWILRSDS